MAGHQRNISSLIWRPILVTLIITFSSITNTHKNNRKAKYKKQNTKGGGHLPEYLEYLGHHTSAWLIIMHIVTCVSDTLHTNQLLVYIANWFEDSQQLSYMLCRFTISKHDCISVRISYNNWRQSIDITTALQLYSLLEKVSIRNVLLAHLGFLSQNNRKRVFMYALSKVRFQSVPSVA